MAHVSAAERRDDFVDAAARAIARHGVAGATTRVIAAEAGAPQATLHYCFGSKEELLVELVNRATASMVERCTVEPGLGMGPTAAAVIRKHAEWLQHHPELSLSTYDLYLWSLPRRRDLADGAIKYDHALLAGTLRQGLVPTDDPDLIEDVARMTIVLMDGLALQWFLHQDDQRLAHEVDDCSRAIELFASSRARPSVQGQRGPAGDLVT